MIVSFRRRLVVLSMPKCASTAIDEALAPYADIVIRHPPALKHMSYRGFMLSIMPLLEMHGVRRTDIEVVSLMREPIEWLASWYRYRARNDLKNPKHPNHQHYTGEISFEDFVRAYASATPPRLARVGDPVAFLSRPPAPDMTPASRSAHALQFHGIGPDRTFRYEDETWVDFLRARTDQSLDFPKVNVSPPGPHAVASKWRQRLGRHYAVYDSLTQQGTPPDTNELLETIEKAMLNESLLEAPASDED